MARSWSRVDAVIGFGHAIDNDEILYGLCDVRRFSWSFAPTMPVPAGVGLLSMELVSSSISDPPPLVVLLRSDANLNNPVDVSLVPVGTAPVDRSLTSALVRPCAGENWVSAFFIEGVGPPAVQPVALRLTAGDSMYQMWVDPKRHTLRATPALRLSREAVRVDATVSERESVSFQPAAPLESVIPVILRRDARGWTGTGGTARKGYSSVTIWGSGTWSPMQEWRCYVLEAPPAC